jgi:[acyl-carrier-protein] S-malonyltransferase
MQEAVPEGTGGIAAILGLDESALQPVCDEAAQGEVGGARQPQLGKPGGHRRAPRGGRGAMALRAPEGRQARDDAADERTVALLAHEARGRAPARAPRHVECASPSFPWCHNRSVGSYEDPDRIRQALVEQLYHPVRWIETIQLLGRRVKRVVECGPGGCSRASASASFDIEYIALQDPPRFAAASAQP